MPRQMREKSETSTYHVMIRGNERNSIFFDDEDRMKFIDILRKKSREKQFIIYAYCLMDNHVHLLINESKDDLSSIMKSINISYVYYFNKKYMRVGHLFQDRFKSEAIEDDTYFLEAARYIHNNPVKANLVDDPGQYKWSSYNSYLGTDELSDFVEIDLILGMFSQNEDKARKLFTEFTKPDNQDTFIECHEAEESAKMITCEKEAKEFVNRYLERNKLELADLKSKEKILFRDNLIKELKRESNLSIRKLAEVLDE